MNFILTVDAGNSKIKMALFNPSGDCLQVFDQAQLQQTMEKFTLTAKNTKAIVSNVSKEKVSLPFETLEIKTLFKDSRFIDMPVHYNETLGLDRLAIAFYYFKTKKLPALLIDTGTFTTADTVNAMGFAGGYILAGLEIIEKSYLRGANLPQAQGDFDLYLKRPHSTMEAVSRGAILSYLTPIEKVISLENYEVIVITGGNAKPLFNYLPKSSSSPLQVDENLIHKALFFIKNMVK